jgi:NAD(P)-dependent dehydrogenase (short-subunit alcohol dehydrogenase family)
MIREDAVWLIAGCSRGLGRALALRALRSRYRVVVTARRLSDVSDIVAEYADAAFTAELDVTKPDQIKTVLAAAEPRFCGIDVLVNNAGTDISPRSKSPSNARFCPSSMIGREYGVQPLALKGVDYAINKDTCLSRNERL